MSLIKQKKQRIFFAVLFTSIAIAGLVSIIYFNILGN
jgi:hypothetical protein